MSIIPFFQNPGLDDAAIAVMGKAFDTACRDLNGRTGLSDLMREIIAKRIIEAAKAGERDPDRLCAKAMDALGVTRRQA